MSEKITARTRVDFDLKVKDTLKRDYPQGSEVSVKDFSQKYGVRTSNVRRAIELLSKEGYILKVPTVAQPVVKA